MIVPLTREEALSKLKAKWRGLDRNSISLGLADIEFKLPVEFKERLKKFVDDEYFHYTKLPGDPELLEAIAEKVRNFNRIDIRPDKNVLLTIGAMNAIWLVTHCFIKSGDRVLVIEPTYPPLFHAPKDLGARVVFLKLKEENNFHLDLEELKKFFEDDIRVIILCNPNNPTGTVFTRDELECLVELALRRGSIILSDEVYEFITYERRHISVASLPGASDIVITISSFTKSFGLSGFRIGYIIADERFIKKMESVNRSIIIQPGVIDQKAALLALTLPEFKQWLSELRDYLRVNRDLIYNTLNTIPWIRCNLPEGTFFIFPNISWICNDSTLFSKKLLRRYKVLVYAGSGFGPSGEGHIRMNFATSRANLLEALERINHFIYEIIY